MVPTFDRKDLCFKFYKKRKKKTQRHWQNEATLNEDDSHISKGYRTQLYVLNYIVLRVSAVLNYCLSVKE